MQTTTAALLQKECHCGSTTRASMIKKKMVRMGTTTETQHQTKVPLPLIPLSFATAGSYQKECHRQSTTSSSIVKKKMVRMGALMKMPMGTTPATGMKIPLPGE
jgi:hypothetical protein